MAGAVIEMELEIEKESTEFKEHLNLIDIRLYAIREKLKGIKTEQIQTPGTYQQSYIRKD